MDRLRHNDNDTVSGGLLAHNSNGLECDLTQEQTAFIKDNVYVDISECENKVSARLINEYIAEFPEACIEFVMSFENETWTFETSTRSGLDNRIYGNHFTAYLIQQAKNKFPDFVTLKPKRIIRKYVTNQQTLKTIYDVNPDINYQTNLLDKFLYETPNGKHTRRVLDDFGLKALSINVTEFEKAPNFFTAAHIILGVRPVD